MQIIKAIVSLDLQGCVIETELEMPDCASDDEIDVEVKEWALERVEISWQRK